VVVVLLLVIVVVAVVVVAVVMVIESLNVVVGAENALCGDKEINK
jgi:hypothetical protein